MSTNTGSTSSGATSTSINTPVTLTSPGLFGNNPIIGAYSFPLNEHIPQKVASELNFILTKITKALDKKAGMDKIRQARYYQALDAYIQGRAKKAANEKDKRILGYLRTRLVTVSKGLLSVRTPGPVVSASRTVVTSEPVPRDPVSTMEFSSLGIDFSHPAFANYDFTQDRRLPKTVTNVLDGFVQAIVSKIGQGNASAIDRESFYKQVFVTLDNKMQMTTDGKERKILQYVRNHVYIRQQENMMLR